MLVPFVASMGFVHHPLTCRSSSWETPSSVKVPKWAVIKTPFCFGSIGDNTTYTTKLCGDFQKLLQGSLVNNQHNGKHMVFLLRTWPILTMMRFPTCPSCLIGSVDRWLFCRCFSVERVVWFACRQFSKPKPTPQLVQKFSQKYWSGIITATSWTLKCMFH